MRGTAVITNKVIKNKDMENRELTDVKLKVRTIIENCLQVKLPIDDTVDLITLGYIDSLSILNIAESLEENFIIEIQSNFMTRDNFSSINNIAHYIIEKYV